MGGNDPRMVLHRKYKRPWIRCVSVRTTFRPGELRDLQRIAKGWSVPLATVVWVIVHDQLARWRKKAPELGPHGLAIAAGLAVTRHVTERRRGGVGAGGSVEA